MPSVSGWALQQLMLVLLLLSSQRFYALGVGLGFGTQLIMFAIHIDVQKFLCPRCRAGLCNTPLGEARPRGWCVSMPSVSGWA